MSKDISQEKKDLNQDANQQAENSERAPAPQAGEPKAAASEAQTPEAPVASDGKQVQVEQGGTNLLKRGRRKYGGAKRKRRRKKKIILPDVVYARNTGKPRVYRIVVDGRPRRIAFPAPGNKAYYVQCIAKMLEHFPIEVLAYSITNKRVYMVIASYDQNIVSYKRFIANVNTLYSEYYSTQYKGSGYMFGSDTRDRRLKDAEDIAYCISVVHSQPSATNLCEGFDYPYSSYRPSPIVNRSALAYYAGSEQKAEELLANSHADGPRLIPEGFWKLGRKDSFTVTIENVLVDYGYYSLRQVPNDVMHRIIAEVNERGDFPFRKIVRKIGLRKAFKYEMMLKVIVDLAINKGQGFDESIANLQIDYFVDGMDKRELIRDVVFMISNRTGYSYDYIMNMLGFAYPNYEFLKELILYVSDMKGISIEAAIKKLGIREHLDYVLALVRNAA